MARKALQTDVMIKLIVGAGQASPSPPVGPALGSKGVKSMDFCKEFNARTSMYIPGTPIPTRITVRPDRSFHFTVHTPPSAHLLLTAAGVEPIKSKLRGAGNSAGPKSWNGAKDRGKAVAPKSHGIKGNSMLGSVGSISLKHVYEIAIIKRREERLGNLDLKALVKCLIWQAGSLGVAIVP